MKTFSFLKLNFLEITLLATILLVAIFLRLYKLSDVPPGVNRDEAAIGYTAYSLLKTGRDEYGRLLPLSFQSFGDWKLPLYIYTTVPFVKIFGLTETAVRLPSALAGILTVFLTFFLVRELFGKTSLALLTTALLAIAPWHLHLSRVESESNVAVLWIVLALLLFLKGLKRPWFMGLSLPIFALTYYTYHGNHVFTTLLILGLSLIYVRDLPRTKHLLIGTIVFSLLTAFIFMQTFLSADKTKISGISIFGNPTTVHEKIELPRNEHINPNSLIPRFFHNRVLYSLETVFQNYLKAFSPEFLFISGGANRAHNVANFGNMYLAEAPFFFLGIYVLLGSLQKKQNRFLLWWLLISPVAASITKDAPHTNRMFAIFPLPPLLVALGMLWILENVKLRAVRLSLAWIMVIALLINFGVYLERYYIHFPRNESQYWGKEYKQLNGLLNSQEYSRKKIVMSRPEYSPYIFLLFYSGYDPKLYQQGAQRYSPTEDQFVHVKSFGRYSFRSINWEQDRELPDTLLVEYSQELLDFIRKGHYRFKETLLPTMQPFFAIVETGKN